MNTMKRAEKTGCANILRKLPLDDLMALKNTVTKRMITTDNTNEAIQAILAYSESASELLKRKRILREFIFHYLTDKKVAVPVNAEKHQLIQKALQYWGVADNDSSQLQLSGGDTKRGASPYQTSNTCMSFSIQSEGSGSGPSMGTKAEVSFSVTHQTTQQPHQPLANHGHSTEIHHQFKAVVSNQTAHSQVPLHHQQNYPTPAAPMSQNIPASPVHQKLGETFVSWFYRILNSNNPSMNSTPEDFGACHFWDDVRLVLSMVTPGGEKTDMYEGGVLVSLRFLALVKDERVLFNPSTTSDSIQVRSEHHGLLVVLACGTVHRENNCLGVFQQMFCLISDPRFENNWKIKGTKLRLKCTEMITIPQLQDYDNSDLVAVLPPSYAHGL